MTKIDVMGQKVATAEIISELMEINFSSNTRNWTDTAEKCFAPNKTKYSFSKLFKYFEVFSTEINQKNPHFGLK